ncbi:MAG: RdgB/HAM1 family non-canonical purine NTP pyrophosphatase [Propionibacteriaceae bacterium]
MITLVLATHNRKKLIELQRIMQGTQCEVTNLDDFPAYAEPVEDGASFEENALIKARVAAQQTGCPALADDSGLEVDALNKMPGIRSARWSGPDATDARNMQLVLDQTCDLQQPAARFVCAMALVLPDGTEQVLQRTMEGHLVREPRGTNGFGYDPIFVPEGSDRTSAEHSPEEKDAISHRGKAVRAMVEVVTELVEQGTLR